jgi:hypothetical protein
LNGQRPDADGDYLKQLVLQRCCGVIAGFMVARQQAAVALLWHCQWQAVWQEAMVGVHCSGSVSDMFMIELERVSFLSHVLSSMKLDLTWQADASTGYIHVVVVSMLHWVTKSV